MLSEFAGTCVLYVNINICLCDVHDTLVITTEKTNILLRYLHQQFDKKVCLAGSYI